MSSLLRGILIDANKLQVYVSYNMDVAENADLDKSNGVLVDAEVEFPSPQIGKSYNWFVNPETKEQWTEEYDRPLTTEEAILQKQDLMQKALDDVVLGGAL